MSEFSDDIKAALAHAAAFVLLELKKLEEGYTTLTAAHPAVVAGVAVAQAEAITRGAPAEEVAAIQPTHVVVAAQEMGTAGLDPVVVAAETKAEGPGLTEAEQATDPKPAVEAEAAAEPVAETKAAEDAKPAA